MSLQYGEGPVASGMPWLLGIPKMKSRYDLTGFPTTLSLGRFSISCEIRTASHVDQRHMYDCTKVESNGPEVQSLLEGHIVDLPGGPDLFPEKSYFYYAPGNFH